MAIETAAPVPSAARPKPARRTIDPAVIISAALAISILTLWEASVRLAWVPPYILPSPFDVVIRFGQDVVSPATQSDIVYTMTSIVAGFAIAMAAGVTLGALIALIPLVDRVISPYVIALQTIPKVAIAPLLIIWFGFGIESKIVIVALLDFFPILVNAIAGFKSTDSRQILMMRALDASAWQIFVKIRIPNAAPFLMAGVYIAIVFSIIGAIIGEFLGSANGLGAQIVQRQGTMDIVGMYSVILILTVIGISLNLLARYIGKRVVFWSGQNSP